MTKKQKCIAAVIAIIVLIGIGALWKFNSDASKGDKQVTIRVVTETKNESFDIDTDALTLSEVLKETKELQVEMEEGAYGGFVTSILGEAQAEKGPWWIYASENNQDCKNADGMCPAVDQVHIQDQDVFEFKLTADVY